MSGSIIDLRDTGESGYFAITEFKNLLCHSINTSLFSYLNHSLTVQGRDLPFFIKERGYAYLRIGGLIFASKHIKTFYT